MINLAKENGGYDNITVQLIEITDSAFKASVYKAIKRKHDLSKTTPSLPPYEEPKKSIPKSWLYGGLAAVPVLILLIYWAFSNPKQPVDPRAKGDSLTLGDSAGGMQAEVDSAGTPINTNDSTQKDTPKTK